MAEPAHCTVCDKPYADRTGRDPCPRCGEPSARARAEASARLKAEKSERLKADLAARAEEDATRRIAEIERAAKASAPPSTPAVRPMTVGEVLAQPLPDQTCPQCISICPGAARVCRFCGYSFYWRSPYPILAALSRSFLTLALISFLGAGFVGVGGAAVGGLLGILAGVAVGFTGLAFFGWLACALAPDR